MSETYDGTPEVQYILRGETKGIAIAQEDKFVVISVDQAKDLHKALEHELALAEDS